MVLAVAAVFAAVPSRASDGIPANDPCHAGGSPAVRSRSPFVDATIEYGLKRSTTLAAQFEALQLTDMIVYVDADMRAASDLRGYVSFISKTSRCRYVRVVLIGRLNLSQQTAILGHELQHVLEIGAHPEVIDEPSLASMYRKFGRRGRRENSYESDGAIETAHRIMNELFSDVSATSSPVERGR